MMVLSLFATLYQGEAGVEDDEPREAARQRGVQDHVRHPRG